MNNRFNYYPDETSPSPAYEIEDREGVVWATVYDERAARVICDVMNQKSEEIPE